MICLSSFLQDTSALIDISTNDSDDDVDLLDHDHHNRFVVATPFSRVCTLGRYTILHV